MAEKDLKQKIFLFNHRWTRTNTDMFAADAAANIEPSLREKRNVFFVISNGRQAGEILP